jgi:peptidoglycan/xylan/chitin deacetylase (PgdA/CDA1 family)
VWPAGVLGANRGGEAVKATLRALARKAVCVWRPRTLVLAYHHVGEPGPTAPWLTVSPARFAQQMAYLADSGLALSLDELLADLRRGRAPRGGRVLVTFDDAALDTGALACPILRRYAVPATLFVPTGLVGRQQAFWWNHLHRLARTAAGRGLDLLSFFRRAGVEVPAGEQRADGLWRQVRFLDDARREELLAEAAGWLGVPREEGPGVMRWVELAALDRDGLFTFGAHSVNHPALANLPEHQLATEVAGSRDALAGFRSFRKVFAYPYGDAAAVDAAAVEAVREAGFEAAFTTREGAVADGGDPFTLERVCVDDLALDDFRCVVDHFLGT